MEHNYTTNQIVLYLFNELDLFTKLELEFAMDDDSTLLDDYSDLKLGLDILPKVTFSPRKSVIDKILDYSKSVTA